LSTGGFDVDFSTNPDQLAQKIATVAEKLVKFGVTSFCPTIVSSSADFYKKVSFYWKIINLGNKSD